MDAQRRRGEGGANAPATAPKKTKAKVARFAPVAELSGPYSSLRHQELDRRARRQMEIAKQRDDDDADGGGDRCRDGHGNGDDDDLGRQSADAPPAKRANVGATKRGDDGSARPPATPAAAAATPARAIPDVELPRIANPEQSIPAHRARDDAKADERNATAADPAPCDGNAATRSPIPDAKCAASAGDASNSQARAPAACITGVLADAVPLFSSAVPAAASAAQTSAGSIARIPSGAELSSIAGAPSRIVDAAPKIDGRSDGPAGREADVPSAPGSVSAVCPVAVADAAVVPAPDASIGVPAVPVLPVAASVSSVAITPRCTMCSVAIEGDAFVLRPNKWGNRSMLPCMCTCFCAACSRSLPSSGNDYWPAKRRTVADVAEMLASSHADLSGFSEVRCRMCCAKYGQSSCGPAARCMAVAFYFFESQTAFKGICRECALAARRAAAGSELAKASFASIVR